LGGYLGNGSTAGGPDSYVPVDVTGLAGITEIATGAYFTCGLSSTGQVICWGSNGSGQLGNEANFEQVLPVTTPVAAVAASTSSEGQIVTIALGGRHACALSSMGSLSCWGSNFWGQLGNGTMADSRTPVGVAGFYRAVAASEHNTCATTGNGAIKCWGLNHEGELGNGTTEDSLAPVDVAALIGMAVKQVVIGAYHSCALLTNASVKCWGFNDVGQLGNGTTIGSLVPVDVKF